MPYNWCWKRNVLLSRVLSLRDFNIASGIIIFGEYVYVHRWQSYKFEWYCTQSQELVRTQSQFTQKPTLSSTLEALSTTRGRDKTAHEHSQYLCLSLITWGMVKTRKTLQIWFIWFWQYLTQGHIWHLSQSSIGPSIYFSLIVKSHLDLFLEPTCTKQYGQIFLLKETTEAFDGDQTNDRHIMSQTHNPLCHLPCILTTWHGYRTSGIFMPRVKGQHRSIMDSLLCSGVLA